VTDQAARPLEVLPVQGMPEVGPGDSIADLVADRIQLRQGDVVVVTQKVVSKAEGRVVDTSGLDEETAKAALVARESRRVLRRRGSLLVTETHHGFVCANAGVDFSNLPRGRAALLPSDPDRSARRIRDRLAARLSFPVGVVVSDTFGRPWRRGLVDVAIGAAGVACVLDLRGSLDAHGRPLEATEVCVADEIASAAELVMGKAKGVPAAVVRGLPAEWLRPSSVAAEVVRPHREDLFR
jgi:coenzyme F420-0:L-glutamate ligase/coenzyme F420-1:gamma-L-glutamate ligase